MKKKVVALIILITLIALTLVGDSVNLKKEDKYLDKVLQTDAYSYLSPAAKEYITEVYESTGEVLLTEQNKEENNPYLNPQFIEYLELPASVQKTVNYIPDSLVVDYSGNESLEATNLPASYNLTSINGKNFTTPMKQQGGSAICWAFASTEAAETLLLKQQNQTYSSSSKVFSPKQLDYATSTDKLIDSFQNNSISTCDPPENCGYYTYPNIDNGSRKLNSGGNFYTSSILMANGLGLVNESALPFTETNTGKWPGDVLNYSKSQYEVNSTIQVPTITDYTASTDRINSYVSTVKNYIYNYGGPFVGTYAPDCSCGFTNTDGKKVMKTDNCITDSGSVNEGHAMQIIGWDDNYKYAYCENGTKHGSVSNGSCSSGTYTTGKGAWLVRNSWGDNSSYKYVYITYDSTNLITAFITSLTSMSNRTWNNNYHVNPWPEQNMSNGLIGTNNQTVEFDTHNKKTEKIEKIKVLSASSNATLKVSITSGSKTYTNIATATVKEPGFYTFNLASKNIILTEPAFSVKVTSTDSTDSSVIARFVKNSISVFTSNVSTAYDAYTIVGGSLKTYDDASSNVVSSDNPAFLDAETSNVKMILQHYTKNLPPGVKLTYKIMKGSEDYSSYFLSSWRRDNPVNNYVYTRLEQLSNNVNKPICGTTFTMQVLYNGSIVQTFPIKRICTSNGSVKYTTSKIKLYKNDGTSSYITQERNDLSKYKLMNSDGSHSMSLTNQGELFKYDKHISSWNTKADGTGTTYKTNEFLLYKDIDLYAQWADGHSYYIRYVCPYNKCVNGSAQYSSTYGKEYGNKFKLSSNTFTNLNGDTFLHWKVNDDIYYEQEEVMDLATSNSPYNLDETVDIETVWGSNYKTISFDANGGTGSMSSIKVPTSENTRLKYNLFTRKDYRFDYWNTEPDGSGTTYTNGSLINTNKDLTLYAQWNESTNPITNISLNKNSLNLTIGNSSTLVATITPTDTTDKKDITWTSSNSSVASVINGKVTAIKAGTTTITATTSNNLKATCMVTVAEQPEYPTGISMIDKKLTLEVGTSYNLVASITPNNALNKTITWESDDTKVARVSSGGKVTAVKAGQALIKAKTANGLLAICELNVVEFSFKDVSPKAWYYEYVKEAYKDGIIAGYSSTKFGPNDKVTRGQLVTFLWRLDQKLDSPSTSPGQSKTFTDVKEGQYYTTAVKWAARYGIVNGYAGTKKFGPNNPIIRQDLALILRNYAKYRGFETTANADLTYFLDYNGFKKSYALDALKWAVKNKVISGKSLPNGGKKIAPLDNTTRAETATMIVNFKRSFNLKVS